MQVGTVEDDGQVDLGAREVVAAILIDFDNLVPPNRENLNSRGREGLLSSIQLLLKASPNVTHITIRLYGGWKKDGVLSRRGSEVAAILRDIDPFPMVKEGGAILRGQVEMAMGLVKRSDFEFDDTYRVRASAPRLKLSNSPRPQDCANIVGSCPAHILKQFTRSATRSCPTIDCKVTAGSAFLASEQKMVDTLLTCDLLEYSQVDGENLIEHVSIVSADTDFVPPLLYVKSKTTAKLQLQVPMAEWSSVNTNLLEHSGILVAEMEGFCGDL